MGEGPQRSYRAVVPREHFRHDEPLGATCLSGHADRAPSNSVQLVICEKYDRVARDSMWMEWAIRHLRDNGFSLVRASEPELADDTDPHRKAMRGMISIFAELEKSALANSALRGNVLEQAVVTIGKVESPMALTTSVVRPDRKINTGTMRRRPANAICGKSNTSEAGTACAGVPVTTETCSRRERQVVARTAADKQPLAVGRHVRSDFMQDRVVFQLAHAFGPTLRLREYLPEHVSRRLELCQRHGPSGYTSVNSGIFEISEIFLAIFLSVMT